jgi:hypothetical protein
MASRNVQQHKMKSQAKDSPQHAPESGEPTETGKQQAEPKSAKSQSLSGEAAKGEHWESGRGKANQ